MQQTDKQSLRAVILEDERMFAEMLSMLLRNISDVDVCEVAHSVAAGISACATHKPDLLLLDLFLPDGSGLRVAQHLLREINPDAQVIVLSGEADNFIAPQWLDPHLCAIVDKASAYNTLLNQIRQMMGKIQPHSSTQNPRDLFTRREMQIFMLIGEGLRNQDIAERLERSVSTILTHRRNITRKMGMSGARLVRAATQYRVNFT